MTMMFLLYRRMYSGMLVPNSTSLYAFRYKMDFHVPKLNQKEDNGIWLNYQCRVRNNWPRPSEHKRLKMCSYKTRMSTQTGRQILMRRILKGRYCLAH